MATLDTITLAGRSGQDYAFRVYPWEHRFRAVPAVYVVMAREIEPQKAPSYTPIYVGLTEDLSQIFEAHVKDECFQAYNANTIAVVAETDPLEQIRIEQDLLKRLNPPCNAQEPE